MIHYRRQNDTSAEKRKKMYNRLRLHGEWKVYPRIHYIYTYKYMCVCVYVKVVILGNDRENTNAHTSRFTLKFWQFLSIFFLLNGRQTNKMKMAQAIQTIFGYGNVKSIKTWVKFAYSNLFCFFNRFTVIVRDFTSCANTKFDT